MMRTATVALNQAALHHLLNEIHRGNYNACKAMGVNEEVICCLQHLSPAKLSRLIYSHVCWGRFEVDTTVFKRLLDGLDDNRESIINRAVRLGASSPMMLECFGLTHSETAQRRRLLRVPTRKGRLVELSTDQKTEIWHRWQALIKDSEKSVKQLTSLEKLDLMMLIAEEQNIVLVSIWQEILSYTEVGNEA